MAHVGVRQFVDRPIALAAELRKWADARPFLLSGKYKIGDVNASEMARALGRRGGRARGKRLSATERKRIASLGGKARRESLQAARRIADNFRYAAALGDLRGQPMSVRRLTTFAGPLPGIYPAGS